MISNVCFNSQKLKFIASIEMGQSPPSTEYSLSPNAGLPFLQGTADFGDEHPIPKVYCSTPTKTALPGDLLFSVRAPVGTLNIADLSYGIGRGLCAIRCRKYLDQRFAWWVLHWARLQLAYEATGSTYDAVSSEDVANVITPFPPLPKQRQIADYLDRETAKIDALLAAKQRLLKLLAEKRQALITQAVTRGLRADISVKDSGIDLLGEVPQHWKFTYLRRILLRMDYGISESVGIEGNIAVLRMGDIYDGEIHYRNVGFVNEVEPSLILTPGDLLFNRTNSLDKVGKVGIFREEKDFPVSFASYLVRMRCMDSVLPEFLNYVLNSSPMLTWARSEALPAIGQANLNPNRYSYLPVALPSLSEQTEILKYIQSSTKMIDSLSSATENTMKLLRERRTSLISAAVTGQIRIAA